MSQCHNWVLSCIHPVSHFKGFTFVLQSMGKKIFYVILFWLFANLASSSYNTSTQPPHRWVTAVTSPNQPLPALTVNSHLDCPPCALAVDTAAKTQARKESSSMDTALSPVPEVVRSVCCASQATQTQSLPVSPQPSTREKVRNTRVVRRREKCTPRTLCPPTNVTNFYVFSPFASSKM